MRRVCLIGVVAMGLIAGCGSQDPSADGGSGGGSAGSGGGGAAGTSGMAGAAGFVGGGGGPGGSGGAPGITTSAAGSTLGGPSTDGGSAPTFTQIYSTVLSVNCAGSECHNPGSQKGISFASQSSAYSGVSTRVIPGDGEGSSFFYTVNSGTMPPGGPKLSAANLAMIRAWIDAGALDN